MEQWQPGKDLISKHERRIAQLVLLRSDDKEKTVREMIKITVSITDNAINKAKSGG